MAWHNEEESGKKAIIYTQQTENSLASTTSLVCQEHRLVKSRQLHPT